jgi:hypothetical protein
MIAGDAEAEGAVWKRVVDATETTMVIFGVRAADIREGSDVFGRDDG